MFSPLSFRDFLPETLLYLEDISESDCIKETKRISKTRMSTNATLKVQLTIQVTNRSLGEDMVGRKLSHFCLSLLVGPKEHVIQDPREDKEDDCSCHADSGTCGVVWRFANGINPLHAMHIVSVHARIVLQQGFC